MAIQSAWMTGAGGVISIDRGPECLAPSAGLDKAKTINFDEEHVEERLDEMTKGRSPDRCIDAVGCEAHSHGSIDAVLDKTKTVRLGTDRARVFHEAILCCRTAGTGGSGRRRVRSPWDRPAERPVPRDAARGRAGRRRSRLLLSGRIASGDEEERWAQPWRSIKTEPSPSRAGAKRRMRHCPSSPRRRQG
jgi:hypothetical protein